MYVTSSAAATAPLINHSDRVPLPNHEIWTVEDYRERYKTYRSDPDLQLLHQTHAWQLVWDDHEVADNTWKSGSADSNDTIAGTYNGTSFTQRKANAVKTYFEWLPIRTVRLCRFQCRHKNKSRTYVRSIRTTPCASTARSNSVHWPI